MTNLSREELKELIKEALREVLKERVPPRESNGMLTLEQVSAIEHCHIETTRKRARLAKIPGAMRRGKRWLVNRPKYERHLGYAPGTLPIP